MRRCVSRAALVLSLVLASGAPAVSADDVPRNTRPFTRFKILLSSAFFNDTLPFDVPFILWGDAPESTDPGALPSTAVLLRIAELRGAARDCSAVGAGSYGPAMRSEARTWSATDYSDRGITPVPTDVATTTRRQFEFMVPKLKPKRVYCFLFQMEPGRRISAAEAVAIAPKLLPAYRSFLQKTGRVDTVGTQGVEALRQALIKEIMAASQFQGMKPLPGTMFDPDAPAADVFETFRTAAVTVLGPHN